MQISHLVIILRLKVDNQVLGVGGAASGLHHKLCPGENLRLDTQCTSQNHREMVQVYSWGDSTINHQTACEVVVFALC